MQMGTTRRRVTLDVKVFPEIFKALSMDPVNFPEITLFSEVYNKIPIQLTCLHCS